MYDFYLDCKNNQNNMSYWLPRIEGKGFNIPETVIIPISEKDFDWLTSDDYKPEEIEQFSLSMCNEISKTGFDTDREMFIKTGNFSNKFVFNSPHLKDISYIGEQFLSVIYGGMCVGCKPSPELILREFIHTSYSRKSIYSGMKLNTEFRCFYNFDSNNVLAIFNYWDTKTMIDNLYNKKDKSAFASESAAIEKDFERLVPHLKSHIGDNFERVDLQGIWSADFMWDGEKFWLIDMALGKDSYYFDELSEA